MENLWGEIDALNKKIIASLKNLYTYKVPFNKIISEELLAEMVDISRQINKEVAIYIDRKGTVQMVSVGTANLVEVPHLWLKRSQDGYSGIRCIHTHPNGTGLLSGRDINALIHFKMDLIAAVGTGEGFPFFSIAYLIPERGRLSSKYNIEEIPLPKIPYFPVNNLLTNLEKQLKVGIHTIDNSKEKAILVVVDWQEENVELAEIVAELKELCKTAGLEVVDIVIQKRNKKNAKYLIGEGKLRELAFKIDDHNANCVIFEDQLGPAQHSNLTKYLGIKILDRTNIILDIFAQRAKSKEGKIQVELAQLSYLLPRLTGKGVNLSRLGGGVGTRGPGETKLETDRRHIRKKIQNLEKELKDVKQHQDVIQKNRMNKGLPIVSLVGYTNAGKSSLLNALANEKVLAEDKLFATLDPTTRIVETVDSGEKFLLTDTVGFIRNLPHQLISAFKSTLEEVRMANVLLHVIDISDSNFMEKIDVVEKVLKELDVLSKPVIYVFNKADLVNDEPIIPTGDWRYCIISAKTGNGLDNLLKLIKENLFAEEREIQFFLPYDKGNFLDGVYKLGKVKKIAYHGNGIEILLNTSQKIPKELDYYRV